MTEVSSMVPCWRPIAELEDLHSPNLLLCAPELVQLDFNAAGVAPGYWQDGPVEVQGVEYPEGTWIAAGFDMCHDEWVAIAVRPTHFLVLEGPPRCWTVWVVPRIKPNADATEVKVSVPASVHNELLADFELRQSTPHEAEITRKTLWDLVDEALRPLLPPAHFLVRYTWDKD